MLSSPLCRFLLRFWLSGFAHYLCAVWSLLAHYLLTVSNCLPTICSLLSIYLFISAYVVDYLLAIHTLFANCLLTICWLFAHYLLIVWHCTNCWLLARYSSIIVVTGGSLRGPWFFRLYNAGVMRDLCFHRFSPNRERTLGLRFVQQYRTSENYYAGRRWIDIPWARSSNKAPLRELAKYRPNIVQEVCGSRAGWTKYKLLVYCAGNSAGSIQQHELCFCAQASWTKKWTLCGHCAESTPQPIPAHDNTPS